MLALSPMKFTRNSARVTYRFVDLQLYYKRSYNQIY